MQALAESADTAAAPVRLGISKPQGAHSVSADYPPPRVIASSTSYHRAARQNEDPHQALLRQMHIRSALPYAESGGSVPVAPLPTDGVFLRPQAKDMDMSLSANSSMMDDSFEELEEDGHELSDQDNERERISFSAGMNTSGVRHHRYHIETVHLGGAVDGDLIDLTSSDEEYPLYDHPYVVPRANWSVGQGSTQEEGNVDEIYPFAWALDGRRIGEQNTNVHRPHSPNSFMVGDIYM